VRAYGVRSVIALLLFLGCACSTSAPTSLVSSSDRNTSTESESAGKGSDATGPGAAITHRKRIRRATLFLTVDELSRSRGALEKLVAKSQGFVENIAQQFAPRASVTMVARVPVEQLDAVVAKARALGRVGQESQESKDVTRDIVDTDARLRNLQRTEERLLALLAQQASALADVLAVERELTRVRGEIEQLTAQLKSLEHDVAMATLTVLLSTEESADLEGPDDAWRPMRKIWREAGAVVARSAAGLVWSAAAAIRALLLLVPWLPLIGLLVFFWRRRRKKQG